MKFRMAIRVVLFLTLTGLCVADFTVMDRPSCSCISNPRNLALRATAVQSSTYSEGEAQRAVDGNRDSDWNHKSCSHTNADRDPWWRVDLGEIYKVTRVSITNRRDCCPERINGVQIRIGNSLDNNGNNNELAATVESIPAGDTQTFEFKSIKGRYVNIVIPRRPLWRSNEYLTLCEVEVFGEKYRPTYNCFPRNLALGAAAVQSSKRDRGVDQHSTYSLPNGAQNAVDGIEQLSCSHIDVTHDPWWRVDLGEVYDVTRVIVTNHVDHVEKMNGAQIRIGNSLVNNGNNNERVDSFPAEVKKTFEFKPIKGRYVNIYKPGRNEHFHLCEVEVFAD